MKESKSNKVYVFTEVFFPEKFIINDYVDYLILKNKKVTVVTRSPSYPYGKIFNGYKNNFQREIINENLEIIRYPFIPNYGRSKLLKGINFIIQPFFSIISVLFFLKIKKGDKIFVYQTGSIYNYCFFLFKKFSKNKKVIWSQDLWPEALYENGIKVSIINKTLSKVTKLILKRMNIVLVQSNSFKIHYKNFYNINSEVVYNFPRIDLKKNSDDKTYNNKKGSLIYSGNLGTVQNIEKIIDLYIKLYNDNVFQCFDIFGDGILYKKLSKKYNDIYGIKFHGNILQNKLIEIISNYEFGIFSLLPGHIRKTIPGRFQFMLQNNLPIIYIGDGEVSDLIRKYDIGITVNDDYNLNEIKSNIKIHRNIDSKIIQNNIKIINNEFLKDKILNKLFNSIN